MKTFQCKKTLLAVTIATVLVSSTAFADLNPPRSGNLFDSGVVSSAGTASFGVSADVDAFVQIHLMDEKDLDLGSYDPTGGANGSTYASGYINNVCLYSNTGGIQVHATSANSPDSVNPEEANLVKSSDPGTDDVIPYQLKLLDNADGSAGNPLQTLIGTGARDARLTALNGNNSVVSTVPCNASTSTPLASFEIDTDAPHDVYPTFGHYVDTVTIQVDPLF